MEHIKQVAKGLENKIIELQQKLDAKVSARSFIKEHSSSCCVLAIVVWFYI